MFNNIKDSDIPADLNGAQSWKDVQWIDMEDPHFIVWMRTAGLPNFRKLWGKIKKDLPVDSYKILIQNNYKVSNFKGKKSFVLSTTNALARSCGGMAFMENAAKGALIP